MSQCRHTSHNKRFSEMAVGVEARSILRPSTSVVAQALAHPIRHFAKPPGVMRYADCGYVLETTDELWVRFL